jgi:probable phosphoglycerate mutase
MKKSALVLFRHGNTFEAGQIPVWVGARTDMPLTAKGETQASAAAIYAETNFDPIVEIVSGPLQRTRRFAEIIAGELRLPFSTDDRLREIDYGLWEGLSSAEIRQRHGSSAIELWNQHGTWPKDMGWLPSEDQLKASLKQFLHEQSQKLTANMTAFGESTYNIAVTSNGILRSIYTLITGKHCGSTMKVRTGHVCVLTPEGNDWHIVKWDEDPTDVKTQSL